MQFIFGPILVALGIAMMRYSVQLTNTFGKSDFAERWLTSTKGVGGAGTYTLWRPDRPGNRNHCGLWFFGMIDVIKNLLLFFVPHSS